MGEIGDYWRDRPRNREARSELGETFRLFKDARRAERRDLAEMHRKAVASAGFPYVVKNAGHHIIISVGTSKFDFWPASGRWLDRDQKQYSNGFGKLSERLRALKESL